MFASQLPPPPRVEMHCEHRVLNFHQQLSEAAVKVAQLQPHLIIGEGNLFEIAPDKKAISLTLPFRQLLERLAELGELPNSIFEVRCLDELNAQLQTTQGAQGGLKRKPGTERWELIDNSENPTRRDELKKLLNEMGFSNPKALKTAIKVDHCIVFGATSQRMAQRLQQTLSALKTDVCVKKQIFLLGSTRKLLDSEIAYLRSKWETLPFTQRMYWEQRYEDPNQCTEASAFEFLWECLASNEVRAKFAGRVVTVNTSRIRPGEHRATTADTLEDLLESTTSLKPQAIYASVEQPHIRMCNQLRWASLKKGNPTEEEFMQRLGQTNFYFTFYPTVAHHAPISLALDEVARNVHLTSQALEFLDKLPS